MMTEFFDARAWLIWVLAAAAVTVLGRNPLYVVILLLVSRIVDWTCSHADSELELPLARVGVIILLFSALFAALFVHGGQTVLLSLPEELPLLGGNITAEAILNGLANGLLLLTLLSLFLAFNRVVTAGQMARLAPRAFQDLGVVVLIALTYVPETARHVRRVREAQALRGHRIEGLRDWQPLVIPLLIGGLERAMGLAETMVARGYGATRGEPQQPGLLAGLALALGLTFGGWIVALWWGLPGWITMGAGVALMAVLIWNSGRRVVVTRYRQRPWRVKDTVWVIASLTPLALFVLPVGGINRQSLYYSFLPQIEWPPFDPFIGSLLFLYMLPALMGLSDFGARRVDNHDQY